MGPPRGRAIRAAEDERYLDSTDVPYHTPTIEVYREVRPRLLALAEQHRVRLRDVECAAFLLSQRLKNDPSRTWRQYIAQLNRRLEDA